MAREIYRWLTVVACRMVPDGECQFLSARSRPTDSRNVVGRTGRLPKDGSSVVRLPPPTSTTDGTPRDGHRQEPDLVVQVNQARGVVDADGSHRSRGPLISRSTSRNEHFSNSAARTGEISSPPSARQTRRSKRRGRSKVASPSLSAIGSGSRFRHERAYVRKAYSTEADGRMRMSRSRNSMAAADIP